MSLLFRLVHSFCLNLVVVFNVSLHLQQVRLALVLLLVDEVLLALELFLVRALDLFNYVARRLDAVQLVAGFLLLRIVVLNLFVVNALNQPRLKRLTIFIFSIDAALTVFSRFPVQTRVVRSVG